ncbi:glycosyltransferase [Conexibacter sp. W3-3-2]|nr:glycosyltransferase [Conexibacter sp. W3-3-2]
MRRGAALRPALRRPRRVRAERPAVRRRGLPRRVRRDRRGRDPRRARRPGPRAPPAGGRPAARPRSPPRPRRAAVVRTTAVVPAWNGRGWLPGLLASIDAQERPFDELVIVDNGSRDGTADWLAATRPDVVVLREDRNRGFAAAANRGIAAAHGERIALLNTDVELAPDWHVRLADRLDGDPRLASVASKLVRLDDPGTVDDAGDRLRRDGVCEQRGAGRPDDGRFDVPGEVFSACAGAALYRRDAVLAVGGFDERLFSYLEDVELGLRLALAGWRCGYEPAVARHAGGGSSGQLARPVSGWVARNTLLLVARAWPWRWAGPVVYRQLAWTLHAARERRLRAHLGGLASALPLLGVMLRERAALRRVAVRRIEDVVAPVPWRGPTAGGHPDSPE